MVDPRSKIQDCSGLLGRNFGSWIRHIEIQYGFNISIWPSLNPRFLPKSPEESWILDLGSTILKFNMDSIFQHGLPRFLPKSPEESWIFQCVSKRPFNLKYVLLRSFVGESEEFNIREYFIFSI